MSYCSPEYMQSVGSEEGWVKRPIPNTNHFDIISQYPFYPTTPMLQTTGNPVTQTIITNPLAELPHMNTPPEEYKTHYVIDLERWSPERMSKNHQKNLKKAKNKGCLTFSNKNDWFDKDCYSLYKRLLRKHKAEGGPSDFYYDDMLAMSNAPGSVTFKALAPCDDGTNDYELVGWAMFMAEGNGDVYYHLSASSELGYKVGSPYALLLAAIEMHQMSGEERFLLGSVADGGSSGLSYFKEGWGTYQLQNYIIKRILDKEVYHKLCFNRDLRSDSIANAKFFPYYRG